MNSCVKLAVRVTPRFVIEIKPHRYGWTCTECDGQTRIFVLKSQAIQFAQERCGFVPAEIRVCDRHGAIQQQLMINAHLLQEAFSA